MRRIEGNMCADVVLIYATKRPQSHVIILPNFTFEALACHELSKPPTAQMSAKYACAIETELRRRCGIFAKNAKNDRRPNECVCCARTRTGDMAAIHYIAWG
jgi:hypothetical protein